MSEPNKNEDSQQPVEGQSAKSFSAFWNKPLKMSEKEIERLKKKNKPIKEKTVGSEIISWVVTLASAVVLALLIRTFLFGLYGVEGESMTNTLQNGERMFCTKIDYLLGSPQRGDVIICHYPGRGNTFFVKRLVALPGDTVEILNRKLYVNGKQIEDPANMGSVPYGDYPQRKLGADEYFVIGDNRGNSNDSRSNKVGPISRSMIEAHVQTVIFPLNRIRTVQNEFKTVE